MRDNVNKSVVCLIVVDLQLRLSVKPIKDERFEENGTINKGFIVMDSVKKDGWTLPGGKIHGFETYKHALKRELKEELNLSDLGKIMTFDPGVIFMRGEYPVGTGHFIDFKQKIMICKPPIGQILRMKNCEPDKCKGIKIMSDLSSILRSERPIIPSLAEVIFDDNFYGNFLKYSAKFN